MTLTEGSLEDGGGYWERLICSMGCYACERSGSGSNRGKECLVGGEVFDERES
jgi:hypothetical protein